MQKLLDVYNQIPQATCPPGCGKCCGPVFPSLAELRNIKTWLHARGRVYLDFLKAYETGDCPYLDTAPDKRCTIYPVRPFVCRLLGASTHLPCQLGKCKPPGKLLNRAQSDFLYKQIYLHGKEKSRTEKHQKIVTAVVAQLAREGRI